MNKIIPSAGRDKPVSADTAPSVRAPPAGSVSQPASGDYSRRVK